MKPIALLTALAATLSGPAHALSCVQPDAVRSFHDARDAQEVFVVLLGTFTFSERLLPQPGDGEGTTVTPLRATFSGQMLQADGFADAPEFEVMLNMTCWHPWCGGMNPGIEHLAYAQQSADGSVFIDVFPCPGWVFWEPTPSQIAAVESCMRGERCEVGDGL